MTRHTVEFYSATDLVPPHWTGWFWGDISEGAPFSWGDNNRTLVTAKRFHDHCKETFDEQTCEAVGIPYAELEAFLAKLADMGETYIDLEN